jgi:hypothetical protein
MISAADGKRPSWIEPSAWRKIRRTPARNPKIPANDAGPPVANPPSMPEGEIQPDDFVKMNDDDMAPR